MDLIWNERMKYENEYKWKTGEDDRWLIWSKIKLYSIVILLDEKQNETGHGAGQTQENN